MGRADSQAGDILLIIVNNRSIVTKASVVCGRC